MPSQISIDPDKCIGCQTCVQIDPETFKTDPKTFKAIVINPNNTNKNTKSAIDSCPVDAIITKK